MEKRKRTRITKSKPTVSDTPIEDPLEFKNNCASENARCVAKYSELEIELWFDKHYFHRKNFGDEQGKRAGIDIDSVQELVIKGFKYLLDIYLRGVKFKLINHFDPQNPKKPKFRTVLQEVKPEGTLNVACEVHFLDTSKFEVTVVTAMQVDEFRIGDGQYYLRLNDGEIKLFQKVRGSENEIFSMEER